MKIKTICIRAFKNLSNIELHLNDKWNILKEDNGFGKTSIAQFVMAMLFGLNSRQKATTEPWDNSGKYGGYLVFEKDGRLFRLERFFGSTARQDSVKLFDETAGREIDATDVGQKLLGLSAESFSQSVYVPQEKISVSGTADLNQRLSGMMDANDDGSTLDDAIKKLQDYGKKLNSGKKGTIVDGRNKKFELEERIAECKKNMQSAEELARDIPILEVESLSLQKNIENLESERLKLLVDSTKADNDLAKDSKKVSMRGLLFLLVAVAFAIGAVVGFLIQLPVVGGICSLGAVVFFGLLFWQLRNEKIEKLRTIEQGRLQTQRLELAKNQTQQLAEQLQKCRARIQEIEFEKGQKLREAELLFKSNNIATLSSELENCLNQLAEDTQKLEVAEKTISLLMQAKTNLSEAYLPKLQSLTGDMLKNFSGGRFTDVLIDKEFNLKITENGFRKPIECFSRGIKEVTAFCFRLALSTLVFGKIPFLILDDPFVNLDEKNFKQAIKMVKNLTKNTQVIYFTCLERGNKKDA